jgi:uncharacterized protein (TIGR02594 family)
MRRVHTGLALLLGAFALSALSGAASAAPKYRHTASPAEVPAVTGADQDPRLVNAIEQQETTATRGAKRTKHGSEADASATAASPLAGLGGSLISTARSYLGTNPTGRSTLWCGAFVDLVLRQTGHPGGGNLAMNYARYGTRVSGPQVGAITVMGRKGGGHVGIVTGVDASGNPIIISGNHRRTVDEAVYPASRIYAYVMPN